MTQLFVPAATALYAGLFAILYCTLSLRVVQARRAARVLLGVGGQPVLERRVRVHANFAEYVPLALVLMLLAELSGYPRWTLDGIGLVLLAGRCVHAFGVSQAPEDIRLRVGGMLATLVPILTLGLMLLPVAFLF